VAVWTAARLAYGESTGTSDQLLQAMPVDSSARRRMLAPARGCSARLYLQAAEPSQRERRARNRSVGGTIGTGGAAQGSPAPADSGQITVDAEPGCKALMPMSTMYSHEGDAEQLPNPPSVAGDRSDGGGDAR
jgi:hypothetical protein